jgi:hypothetical protein
LTRAGAGAGIGHELAAAGRLKRRSNVRWILASIELL